MKTLKIVSFGIKNNRVLAGFMLLICGFAAPVLALLAEQGNYSTTLDHYIPAFGSFAAYFAGILFPIVFYSYTHKRRENDFYAAMPVKKRQYFWGYFLAGIIMFIIPLFIMDFVLMLFSVSNGHLRLSDFIGPLAIFFSIYCSMTLAVMFSGSVVSTIITFLLRNIFVISLVVPILFMAGVDIESYYILLFDKAIVTSPLLSSAAFLEIDSFWWIWIWQFGIGILEVIAAFFLHKYRRSETTMALAFPKSRLPYQYIVLLMFVMTVNTVVMIVLGFNNGIFNRYYLWNDRFSWDMSDIKAIVFFDVIAAFLMFILLNIVLERSSRAAFKGIRHLLFFFVGFFALAGLSGRLLNYIPRIYTPIEPDYAVVSVYRPADPDSVDINSEEFVEAYSRGEYQGNIWTEYNVDGSGVDIRRVDWLYRREEYFVVTNQKSLDELVRTCEGERVHYNIIASDYLSRGHFVNWNDRWGNHYFFNNDEDEALYFDIILAKGRCAWETNRLGETVCNGYYVTKGLSRWGYVIGTASGLDIYKDFNIELSETENDEYYENYEYHSGAMPEMPTD